LEQLVIVGFFGRFLFVSIVESTPTRSMRICWLRDSGAVTPSETLAEVDAIFERFAARGMAPGIGPYCDHRRRTP
jgi:hypothetical protein